VVDDTAIVALEYHIVHLLPEAAHAARVASNEQLIDHRVDVRAGGGRPVGNAGHSFIAINKNGQAGGAVASPWAVSVAEGTFHRKFVEDGAYAGDFHSKLA